MILTMLNVAIACNSDIGARFMQTLYQYKSALPYMGCCTLPSAIFHHQTTKGCWEGMLTPKWKNTALHNPTDDDQGVVA